MKSRIQPVRACKRVRVIHTVNALDLHLNVPLKSFPLTRLPEELVSHILSYLFYGKRRWKVVSDLVQTTSRLLRVSKRICRITLSLFVVQDLKALENWRTQQPDLRNYRLTNDSVLFDIQKGGFEAIAFFSVSLKVHSFYWCVSTDLDVVDTILTQLIDTLNGIGSDVRMNLRGFKCLASSTRYTHLSPMIRSILFDDPEHGYYLNKVMKLSSLFKQHTFAGPSFDFYPMPCLKCKERMPKLEALKCDCCDIFEELVYCESCVGNEPGKLTPLESCTEACQRVYCGDCRQDLQCLCSQ